MLNDSSTEYNRQPMNCVLVIPGYQDKKARQESVGGEDAIGCRVADLPSSWYWEQSVSSACY
jgi:hypothetical protein